MQNVSLYLQIGDVFAAKGSEEKFPLAKSEHFSGTFAIIKDYKYTDRQFTITLEYDIPSDPPHFSPLTIFDVFFFAGRR